MANSDDNEVPDDPFDEEAESRGWEGIIDLTGGLNPEDIPELRDMRHMEFVYPLLRSLVGRSPREFIVRTSVLRSIVLFEKAWLSSRNLDEALYWLIKKTRDSTIRSLRSEGWLEFNPSKGTRMTYSGQWAYEVIGFLLREAEEDELAPTVESLAHAISLGVPPLHYLSSMKTRLLHLLEEINDARKTYSPIILRRAADKVDAALTLSERIRAVLNEVDRSDVRSRNETNHIHELLSRLHNESAQLHKEVVEVGRQYLRLQTGVTHEQIVTELMMFPEDELVAIAHEAILPNYIPPVFLTQEVLIAATESQMLRERGEPLMIRWEEPAPIKQEISINEYPDEVVALLKDLQSIYESGDPTPLSEVVPDETISNSLLRASLMALVGESESGEGIAGRIGVLPLQVETENDGWPEDLDAKIISKLTPGFVKRRE